MPCYQVNVVSVEFQAKHAGTLAAAVKSLGGVLQRSQDGKIMNVTWDGQTVTIQDGQATGRERRINELRVAYSRQVVQQATAWAKQKGWNAQQTGSKTTLTKGR